MAMFDLRDACETMIRQQLRTDGILNENILQLIRETPRELFVPTAYRDFSYADFPIPLAHGQQMLLPESEGLILQSLDIQPDEQVLEIGTGSGYFSALLAQLAASVHSVDIFQNFIDAATTHPFLKKFRELTFQCADASQGPLSETVYDVIVISGALPILPQSFFSVLRPGGRLCAVIGGPTIMEAFLWERASEGLRQTRLFETVIPYLINARNVDTFKF